MRRDDSDLVRLAEILEDWGIGIPRGAAPRLKRLLAELRGDQAKTVKELAVELSWSTWRLYSLRSFARRRGDSPFVGAVATRRGVQAWMKRHPEFRSSWRRHEPRKAMNGRVAPSRPPART